MRSANIDLLRRQRQQALRVVHVATQADPYVTAKMRPGLSQVAGKVPAAQTGLGLETSLVLPLFRTTQEIISNLGQRPVPVATLKLRFGPEALEAEVTTLPSATEPQFPIYFIGNAGYFGQAKMYGWTNDLERFAFFCHAAMELQRHLGTAPDVFDCHDWQSSLLPVFLRLAIANSRLDFPVVDKFFNNTAAVLSVHDFAFTGQASNPAFHQLHLGWERYLPGYAEFYGQLSPLKAGLYQADRTLARSQEYIRAVIEERYGLPGFSGIARERFAAGRLVGLWADETAWRPDQELTDELALDWAKRTLAVYRSVVPRPFAEMSLAEATSPPSDYLSLTAYEELSQASPVAAELYLKLNRTEKALIEDALDRGERKRFTRVKEPEDLRDILRLLRLEPAAGLEAKLIAEGLQEFIEPFFAGDIDRIFSLDLTFSRCPALVEELRDSEPGFSPEKISIFEAFSRYRGADNTSLLDHTIGLLKTLKRISLAIDLTDGELAEELAHRGNLRGKESLSGNTADFRHFFAVFNYVAQEQGHQFYRAFLVAVLLHDLGKIIRHDTHARVGGQMLKTIRAFRGLLNDPELEFARKLIQHHSIFGDTIVLREQNPDDMHEIHDIFPDRRLRDLAIKALYLIGIADMDAIGRRGRLTPESIRKVRQAYHAVLFARDTEHLSQRLEDLGFGQEFEGANRWNRWVVREKDANKEIRERDASLAALELEHFAQRSVEREMHDDLVSLSDSSSSKRRKGIRRQFHLRVREKIAQTKQQLGALEDIRKMDYLSQSLEDARLRARLLIWLAEHTRTKAVRNVSFELNFRKKIFRQELTKLVGLLEKFDLEEISNAFEADFDMAEDLLELYLPLAKAG
ncbi:MAG: glycogen/starch synthase [Candidatus Saganbacteria bacterium]|nr:glycogen/starch synthase [Candidatus Saganbacteria bacterium]